METFVIGVITLIYGYVVYKYPKEMKKAQTEPAMTMWFLFALAVIINFASFLATYGKWDWIAGTYQLVDALMCFGVILGIMFTSKWKIVFHRFEILYLVIASLICLFWFISGSSFGTNLLTQILILIGYGPTLHKTIKHKKSSEPLSIWIPLFFAAALSLELAIASGKTLSIIYSLRATVSTILLLTFLFFYRIKRAHV